MKKLIAFIVIFERVGAVLSAKINVSKEDANGKG